METVHEEMNRVHHGRNIKRIRMAQGMKQTVLAEKMQMAQQTVSKYELKREIEEDTLQQFATALNVSLEDIRDLEDDCTTIVFENYNTIETNTGNVGSYLAEQTINNPIDQVVGLFKEFLAEERRKNDLLEEMLRKNN